MNITKKIPHTVDIDVSFKKCDICGTEREYGKDAGWMLLRGACLIATDGYAFAYDLCSPDCAIKAVQGLAVHA